MNTEFISSHGSQNGKNAGFEIDIFSMNFWQYNYWDDWHLPFPKPIYGYAIIRLCPSFGVEISWINFDIHPRIER